jgi:ATP-dependent DNA ligase
MLAKRVGALPASGSWIFEPKWDGFRALVFRDGDEILIQSRDEKSLNRYFPELLEPLGSQLPPRCVLDGEIVVANNRVLDFEALQLRIHPAASRVKLLPEIPHHRVFDPQRGRPDPARRRSDRRHLDRCFHRQRPIHVPRNSRVKHSGGLARRFEGAGLDGVIAKPVLGTYTQ